MTYKNKAISNAMLAIDNYIKAAKAAEKARKEVAANYRGDMLKKESERIYGQLLAVKGRCADAVNAALADMKRRIDAFSLVSLDAATISQDFAFLNLPVTLSTGQLTQLAERNKTDGLFIQALNEYAKTHNIDLVFETRADALTRAYNEFKGYTAAAVDTTADLNENADALSWDMLAGLDAIESIDNMFCEDGE